jgi:zinc/manganese transport system substrate-binding protein
LLAGPLRRTLATLIATLITAVLPPGLAGCGGGGTGGGTPRVVVTHAVLGAVVKDLVGDRAAVTVLIPNGTDPHAWRPSAKDVEQLRSADLVVANGLGLEEGLTEALERAREDGVPVLEATDYVRIRRVGEAEAAEPAEGEGHGEDVRPGAPDPHFWTDPASMRKVAAAIATALGERLDVDVRARWADLDRRLRQLDAETEQTLAAIPPQRRKLVTGHESLGYFARRYRFELVGAIVPSLSSQARVSAEELASLVRVIRREGVDVVFTEVGTPRRVAEAVAEETGARLVELPAHRLPEHGSYETFIREMARIVAGALG